MHSNNPRPEFAFHRTAADARADRDQTNVVSARLQAGTSLSIADDPDFGCDPYNSTGQHVILDARLADKRR